MARLRRPQRVEFRLQHRARRVEGVFGLGAPAGQAGAHAVPVRAPPREEGAQRRRAGLRHLNIQPVDGGADLARLLRVAGAAHRLEAPALVDVEKRAADLLRLQPLGQPPRAKLERVEPLQRLARRPVARHQAEADQRRHQPRAAHQRPVAPPPHLPRDPPRHGQRAFVLWIAPVREDAHAHAPDALRLPIMIQVQHAPAKGIGAKVKGKAVGLHGMIRLRTEYA